MAHTETRICNPKHCPACRGGVSAEDWMRAVAGGLDQTKKLAVCTVTGAQVVEGADCGVSDTRFINWQLTQMARQFDDAPDGTTFLPEDL